MATRLKTVEYWFPHLATIPDASATSFTQITINIPEASSTITFRKVIADLVIADVNTTLANITQRQIEIQLGSAGYDAVNNTQTLSHGGENFVFHHSTEHTSYFNSNWTGTSMTCDARITVNTGTLGCRNASLKLVITYEYDDTVTTQLKTVWIPLNAPTGALGTAKPGTANDTIPALDTYCPETSKTFRQTVIVVQGNTEGGGAVDKSISFEVGTYGAFTSQLYELGTTVDIWYRISEVMTITDKSITHGFYLWGSTADFDHAQAWMVVTYEFNASTTTTVLNSLLMPMEFDGAMGYNNTGYQRAKRDIMIQEPGTITLQRLAYYMFYDKATAITGLNARVGTGSFVSYTCVAGVLGGGAGLMIRNDSEYTFSRGRNTISVDVYRTDTADLGYNVSGFWIINYTSGKHTNGVGVHNHTVIWNLGNVGTGAGAVERITSASAITLPASNYYLSAIGVAYLYTSQTTAPAGAHIGAERLSGEGGIAWEQVYEGIGGTDAETGLRQVWATARTVFKRWANEYDSNRLDIETSRRWRCQMAQNSSTFDTLDIVLTYHSIQYTVSGNITGSNGGTVNLYLCRASNGERLLSTSRVGDGAYSFTWYDDTEDVYVDAYEDSSHLGRSNQGTP